MSHVKESPLCFELRILYLGLCCNLIFVCGVRYEARIYLCAYRHLVATLLTRIALLLKSPCALIISGSFPVLSWSVHLLPEGQMFTSFLRDTNHPSPCGIFYTSSTVFPSFTSHVLFCMRMWIMLDLDPLMITKICLQPELPDQEAVGLRRNIGSGGLSSCLLSRLIFLLCKTRIIVFPFEIVRGIKLDTAHSGHRPWRN